MYFSVTKNGVKLDESLYVWDEKTKTFSTKENNLVLDFSNLDNVTFKTGNYCTFDTGCNCTFDTGGDCVFNTSYNCVFDTGWNCTFDTGGDCVFNTSYNCTFKTEKECVIIRRDIYEIIEIPENIKIKLNDYRIKGYQIIKEEEKSLIGKTVEVKIDNVTYSAIINNKKEE